MPKSALTGSRIRSRRIDLGLRQAALAEACGISASYLNLIEHNRRGIGGKLLNDLARALETEPGALAQGADDAVLEDLLAAAGSSAAEIDRAEEFAGRFPGWAGLVRAQARRLADHAHTIETLSDRLAHDPFLSDSLHNILTTVTAIRSTSAILAEEEAIDPAWQARFHRNLFEDSRRLAEATRALAAYLDAGADTTKSLSSPQEEFDGWLERRGYRFAEIEDGAADHEAIIAGAVELSSSASRALARAFLVRYEADSRAMPEETVRRLAAETGRDPAAMAVALGAGVAAAFRRIAVLGLGAEPLGLAVCDGAGAMVFRKPVDGFAIPRFGAACPLWPLFAALGRPMAPVHLTLEPEGETRRRFTAYAIAETSYPMGLSGPPLTEATMLILPEPPPGPGSQPGLRVGMSCRICGRTNCAARREPSVLSERDGNGSDAF